MNTKKSFFKNFWKAILLLLVLMGGLFFVNQVKAKDIIFEGNIDLQDEYKIINITSDTTAGTDVATIDYVDSAFDALVAGGESSVWGCLTTDGDVCVSGNNTISPNDGENWKVAIGYNPSSNPAAALDVEGNVEIGGTITVNDFICSDCLGLPQIEDIYVLNTSDTMTGYLGFSDKGSGSNQLIKMGGNQLGGIYQISDRGGLMLTSADDTLILADGDTGRYFGGNINPDGENTYILSDGNFYVKTDLQEGWGTEHTLRFSNAGILAVNENTVWHAGNDGSGSGLDADLLDSVSSGSFLRSDTTDNYTSGTLTFNSGTELDMASGSTLDINGTIALPTTGISGAGSGSGLDADLLDSVSSGSFLRSDTTDYLTSNIYFRGDLVGGDDGYRDHGVYGNYDSYKTDHIWSMGTGYRNAADGSDFGNLYGLAYKHTNNTTGGTMAGGHQMVWVVNGTGRAALGTDIWTSGNLIVQGGGSFGQPVTVGSPSASSHAATKGYVDGAIVPADGYIGDIQSHTAGGSLNMGNNAITNINWAGSDDGSGSGLDADLLDGQHGSYYATANEVTNLGSVLFDQVGTTTDAFITKLEDLGAFDNFHSIMKASWNYAGNTDITDTGFGTLELAGCVVETWTDNASDTVRGNIHVRVTRPTTGAGGSQILVYNDQGPTYSPGWREIWTSTSDGSGSGLDADLLDGISSGSFLRSDTSDYLTSGDLYLGGGTTYSVQSDGDADLRYVGILTNPSSTYPLYVNGNAYLTGTTYMGTTSYYVDTSGNANFLSLAAPIIIGGTGSFTSTVSVATPTASGHAATKGYVDGIDALPAGSSGNTLRHNGSDWIANDFLYNDGSYIGIGLGTVAPAATLDVNGGIQATDITAIETVDAPVITATETLRVGSGNSGDILDVNADLYVREKGVGVGTTAPTGGIHIKNDNGLKVEASANTYAGRLSTTGPTGGLILAAESDMPLVFKTNNIEKARILGGTETAFGIGTATPQATLHVDGSAYYSDYGRASSSERLVKRNLGSYSVAGYSKREIRIPWADGVAANLIVKVRAIVDSSSVGTRSYLAKTIYLTTYSTPNYIYAQTSHITNRLYSDYISISDFEIDSINKELVLTVYWHTTSTRTIALDMEVFGRDSYRFLGAYVDSLVAIDVSELPSIERVSFNGSVGIGTATPQATLHVQGFARGNYLTPTDNYHFATKKYVDDEIGAGGADGYIGDDRSHAAGGSLNMGSNTLSGSSFSIPASGYTYFTSGNVGIGVNAPGEPLQVGTATTRGAIRIMQVDDAVSDHLQFYNGSTRMGEIGTQDTSWLRINQVTAKNIYTPRYIRADDGFYVDGTTYGITGTGVLKSAGGATVGGALTVSGKLTAGEVDPPYSIDGTIYATYGHSTTGLKEETVGKVSLQKTKNKKGEKSLYSAELNFDKAEQGSDLWLFREVSAFGEDWNDLVVSLTSEGRAEIWYEFIPEENKLIIYGNQPVKVSYRLIAPRFDWPERDTNLYNQTGEAPEGVGIFIR